MLSDAEFRVLLGVTGIPVTFKQTKLPSTVANLRAIVQPLGKFDEALINAYGTNSRSIQFAAADLSVEPVKFDAVDVGAERWVIDTVQAQHSRVTGAVTYFVCYAKGR